MMYRGTTPTHTFTIPEELCGNIKASHIIYSQFGKVILIKELCDCQVEGNVLSVKLTQEETFLFDSCGTVEMQVRILTQGGDALASDIFKAFVGKLLEDEVLQ